MPPHRSSLALILPNELASTIVQLHRSNILSNRECSALIAIPLPLPETDGAILARVLSLIPDASLQRSIENMRKARPFPSAPGAGINMGAALWLKQVGKSLRDESLAGLSLLSTIEDAAPAYGYPNCDVLFFCGYGKVDRGETTAVAALRETKEEARVVLPDGALERSASQDGPLQRHQQLRLTNVPAVSFNRHNNSWQETRTVLTVHLCVLPTGCTARVENGTIVVENPLA